jgi:hypothetical protein
MRLVYANSKEEVKIGDVVRTFYGENVQVTNFEKPHHGGSTGRVYVKCADHVWQQVFYPSVVGAVWIEREDQE